MGVMDDILEHIKAHALECAEIIANGGIGVVVYQPDDVGKEVARSMGWDGEAPVFHMSASGRRRMAQALADQDRVTVAWLSAKRDGRIFVIAHGGTLLVNYEPGKGYSLEPGSSDEEFGN